MSKTYLAFVDQHKFVGVSIQSFNKYRGKKFPCLAQNRNWSIMFKVIRFPLFLKMGIIFPDSHVPGILPE
jgi:hypothetical protein